MRLVLIDPPIAHCPLPSHVVVRIEQEQTVFKGKLFVIRKVPHIDEAQPGGYTASDMSDVDSQVRLAAFQFLEEQQGIHGDVLPKTVLSKGFGFRGERVPLIAPQGIFKPKVLELPLTFCTVPPNLQTPAPYNDEVGDDGLIRYRYRGADPDHRDNVGLRTAMKNRIPLIYLYGIVPGQYLPVWPVFVVGDDPSSLTFSVAADEQRMIQPEQWEMREAPNEAKRRYITVEVQARLHQRSFRERVLQAYRDRCAVCSLRHRELLEAAHILSDKHPLGEPVISNGLALCTLHHAAFEKNIMGIRPDYVIEIRKDILAEHDGPMLKHGLQGMQGQDLHVPRAADFKPNPEFLEIRYDEFSRAG